MKISAATNRVRAAWNGNTVLDGHCSKVIACQLMLMLADEFSGSSRKDAVNEAERVGHSLLNHPGDGAATHFYFGDETGTAELIVNF
jgi:hypothetical protein